MDSRFSNAYDNVTTLHPIGVALLVLAVLAIFAVRRDWIFLPIMLLTCLAPASQRIVVLGFDLHFLRMLTLAAWIRLLSRSETRPLRWLTLDKVVLWWAIVSSLIFFLRRGTLSSLVNSFGQASDALGLYFLGRQVIREWRDIETLVRSFALASVAVSVFAVQEIVTGKNPFAFYGYVPELAIVRSGRVRLRGAFSHQILAGCYWVVPTFLCCGMILQKRASGLLPWIGLGCSLFLIIASASSTPLLGLALGVLAASFWPMRERMGTVRWGVIGLLIAVQLAMSKPIWHLYQRVGALGVGGSTGYHRYRLVDAFVRNFDQWALLGTNSTGVWGRQLEDVTNHFIGQGVRTGLAGFLLFLAVFVFGFAQIGAVRTQLRNDKRRSAFAWFLGVALFAQMMTMTATSYFGQILLVLWVTLAAIGSISAASSAPPVPAPEVPAEVRRPAPETPESERSGSNLARRLRRGRTPNP